MSTPDCTQLKLRSFKQFKVKAPKGLKGGAVYEIHYNAKGIPNDIILILDTFITRKHKKPIGITIINQSDKTKWIPHGQHIGTVHLVEGRTPLEEVQEIIHQSKVSSQDVDKVNTGKLDDFINSNDQVQMKKPVQYSDNPKLSPAMKRRLDEIINEYSDIFSKDQYDIGTSMHPQ